MPGARVRPATRSTAIKPRSRPTRSDPSDPSKRFRTPLGTPGPQGPGRARSRAHCRRGHRCDSPRTGRRLRQASVVAGNSRPHRRALPAPAGHGQPQRPSAIGRSKAGPSLPQLSLGARLTLHPGARPAPEPRRCLRKAAYPLQRHSGRGIGQPHLNLLSPGMTSGPHLSTSRSPRRLPIRRSGGRCSAACPTSSQHARGPIHLGPPVPLSSAKTRRHRPS